MKQEPVGHSLEHVSSHLSRAYKDPESMYLKLFFSRIGASDYNDISLCSLGPYGRIVESLIFGSKNNGSEFES